MNKTDTQTNGHPREGTAALFHLAHSLGQMPEMSNALYLHWRYIPETCALRNDGSI
jgi:hypothetical protein